METTRINAQAADHLNLLDAALGYIGQRHWEVALGTEVLRRDGRWSCSCADPRCAAFGAHPARPDWPDQVSGQPSRAHEWWSAQPRASVILPTGRSFDVLEVSEQAGCLALARLERSGANLGPVAATPTRRMYFFVLPNAQAGLAKMLPTLGWGNTPLDLVCRGAGDYVVAPPSRMGVKGQAQWVRPPAETNRWLPDAEELAAPLSYACGQHR
ncbi:MAG TPA: bifunctional DNA primase/polymerase [Actinocrinis sp.]|nr:bifunctional DNA primase/polymerase [Actinocrinis sp.]